MMKFILNKLRVRIRVARTRRAFFYTLKFSDFWAPLRRHVLDIFGHPFSSNV